MVAFPCDFRIGSTGFGLIGGIGAGVGFLKPLQLGSIPAVGQIAGSLVASLSTFDSALGNPGNKVRRGIQRSGVKGLDCSAGCGVFVGYGYGIGLFLKPQAAEALQQLMQKAQGRLQTALQKALPRQIAERASGKEHHFQAARRGAQPSQLGHQLNSASSSERGLEAGAASALDGTAVPVKLPAHLNPDSNTAMTEATAQRLVEALNAYHTGLEDTSQTLSEASRHLKDVCLLLKGPRHRF
ncbi:g10491 [Coccomyxa viridis]|uniref:G10491 protein n=1 Tax=Coccomyxa viridis TaxID=1274662 RepID=A0ABP1G5M4_9CHLO